jgi:acyl-CoA thioesterase-2
MHEVLADLLHLLKLEQIEDNIYRGESRDIGSAQVFGGQVLGQALTAASYTVSQGTVHSLHAYFLRRGDMQAPIVYQVDRARDGRSFTNRRVVAIQHGRPILNMAASFQVAESGLEHQVSMPEVPGPEGLRDVTDIPGAVLERLPAKMHRFLTHERPFEFRVVETYDLLRPEKHPPLRNLWLKIYYPLTNNLPAMRLPAVSFF